MSTKATVILALSQVWIAVLGTLATALSIKLIGEDIALPTSTWLAYEYGFAFVAFPFLSILGAAWARMAPLQRRLRAVEAIGVGILAIFVLFFGHAALRPWSRITVHIHEVAE